MDEPDDYKAISPYSRERHYVQAPINSTTGKEGSPITWSGSSYPQDYREWVTRRPLTRLGNGKKASCEDVKP